MNEFLFIKEELIIPYKEYCILTDSWTTSRRSCLQRFDAYCFKNWPNASELSQEMIDGWCTKRPTEKISSMGARVRTIQHFLRYLRERRLITLCDPKIPSVKRHSAETPHHFTEEELQAFFRICDRMEFSLYGGKNTKNLQLTLPVFFRLLYSSGMRPMGVRMLKREDVDLKTGVVSVRKTKGANQHFVVLHDTMRELMETYDCAINKLYPNREYFFPGKNGSFHTTQWVSFHFRKIWSQVGSSRAVPYSFRHNYAVTNINSWIGIGNEFHDKFVYLSKSMGHSELEHTKYYYSLVPAMADILEEKLSDSSVEIIPEVNVYEKTK